MPEIVAANNLMIHIEDDAWRMFNGRGDDSSPLVEASPDGLSYGPAFATARRLSPNSRLSPDDIAMVVVGWAAEDSSWHLGLMVTPEIAQARGGRWCGLARWQNHDGSEAERAGAALATTLSKPFRFVPPVARPQTTAEETAPAEVVEAPPEAPAVLEAPPIPPMSPPISIGEWTLEEHPQGLIWVRPQSWRTRMLLYGLFCLGLSAIFASLSLGAKLSPYAPVQPDWLPLVGLGIAVVVLGIAIWQILALIRATSVLIDNHQRLVRVKRGSRRVILQVPYEGIEYLLVSHVLNRREAASSTDLVPYDRIWPEVWIHLHSPRRGFIQVCYTGHTEGRMQSVISFDQRRPLRLGEIDTPVHHAAHLMAEMIGVPAFVEAR